MDSILTQALTISNHPIKHLKSVFRRQYVCGIGELLCYITKNDGIAKFVFRNWCAGIVDNIPKDAWSYTTEFIAIRDALSIHRDGWTFFTMRQSFLFDCFYLLEKSGKDLRTHVYAFLDTNVCGFFTKGSLTYAYDFFMGRNSGDKLPDVLRRHRRTSLNFRNKKLKRVLVVATMSAGKSTLVNALVGDKINQVRSTACTSIVHHIYNKPVKEGAFAWFNDGKIMYTEDYTYLQSEAVHSIGVNFMSSLKHSRICILDTPGVNYSRDKSHGELTRKMISENNYDLLLLILNATQLAIEDERDLVAYVGQHTKRKVIGVLNQCDLLKPSQDSVETAINTCCAMMTECGIKSPVVIPISAQAAYLSRLIAKLGSKVDEDDSFEYEKIMKKLKKPFYNLPAYLPGVPKDISFKDPIERSGVTYLEFLIKNT